MHGCNTRAQSIIVHSKSMTKNETKIQVMATGVQHHVLCFSYDTWIALT